MYLIELVTDRFLKNNMTRIITGYKENEESAREYCERKTKELEGNYNENMGSKYYEFTKINLIED